jgi:hypothetical protein
MPSWSIDSCRVVAVTSWSIDSCRVVAVILLLVGIPYDS